MSKFFVLSVVAATFLYGGDKVELFGTQVDANGSIANTSGDPVMVYQDQVLSANKLTYDKNTSIVEAFGNVNVYKAGQYHIVSDYSRLDLDKDTRYSKPYYSFDSNSSAWMAADVASGCENKIDLTSGMVSGCNSIDPLWKIHFSRADYDTQTKWVNIYNALLYMEDVPVMYLPYFGYPTDRTRRTGLLIPTFGLSSSEGFYYEQPLFWAPTNWFDATFTPQIRTSRGSGVYAEARFVDSPTSHGAIKMGYFNEQSSYAQEYDLANTKHYGFGLDYQHKDVLKNWFGIDLEGESGLYMNGMWMNDVDYLNLQQNNQTLNVTANQVFSRINGYYSSEDNYVGAYFKHYQYLDQTDNAKTLQTLPTLQYHRYLENFLDDRLLVSGDAQVSNFYRPDGKRAVQTDVSVPLTLQTGLFDNYLDVSYTANNSLRSIGFYGNTKTDVTPADIESNYGSGHYAQMDHTFSIGSVLVKPYDTMTHILAPTASYTKAGSRKYNGYYEKFKGQCDKASVDYNPQNAYPCEFYTLNKPSDTLSLGVNNYLFDGSRQWLVDRLSQVFRYDDVGNYYDELQNELEWEVTKAISYYNQTSFNHDRNRITKEQNTLRYNDGTINGSVGHYYTDVLVANKAQYSSYWNADIAYQYNRHYKFFGVLAYDYQESLLKNGEIGFLYTQRCWDFGLKFVQNRRPVVTNTNGANDSVEDSFLFITIILKPLGGSDFNYKLTNNK
jgi:LPS-assembly protein